jgi:hypothetical protein
MARYLVIFKDQIDGTDVNGFKIMSDKELTDFEQLAESITWGFSYIVGETKIYFANGEDLLSRLEYKEVTLEESRVFKKLFDGEFGVFVNQEFIDEISREESDEDDYEDETDEEDGLPYYDDDKNDDY